MPYYRITIALNDNKTTQGIRYFDNTNIDAVTNIVRVKARQHYGEQNVQDVEAAMLSNHCKAVKEHRMKLEKKKDKYGESSVTNVKRRKDNYKDSFKSTLGDGEKK